MGNLQERFIKAAEKFLVAQGYEILDQKWEGKRGGYLDLVAKDDDEIVFIDVKANEDPSKGFPAEDAQAGRERMEVNSAMWLSEHDTEDTRIRFDVISLMLLNDERAMLRHHINAFSAVIA